MGLAVGLFNGRLASEMVHMGLDSLASDTLKTAQEVLGYLNFSAGAPDPLFLKAINELFGLLESGDRGGQPSWRALAAVLAAALEELGGSCEAFREVAQARAVLGLVFDHVLPAYRQHHSDLLFHQSEEQLFRPFFIGRVCEAVLQQGGPWDQRDRIVGGALGRLNDYLGHRPVAVLETGQEMQPYAHERVRPIPLFVRGAGVAVGRYRELIDSALALIEQTDAAILREAFFDPGQLEELAVDPRAYDFDHPANKRPNYPFGQWDMHCLDNSGRCRRFVLQEVSLEAMLARVENRGELPYEEVLFEAAAVLAGTMLMGSGVSGNAPDAHDSTTTLGTLVQKIAAYRDAFYERLLGRLSGPHAERLRAEARLLQQPFGGARQDFNQEFARRRSEQLQHVQLARLFARMGYTEAAARQVRQVAVASARMQCDMYCRITAAELEMERGRLEEAAALLPEIEDLLQRAVECGAVVDPWNILGFAGQYSLFPAPENSVPDHRVEELIGLIGAIFDLNAQLQQEAAAAGKMQLQRGLSARMAELAGWWDKYASLEVASLEGISGREASQSAEHVAAALRAWHEGGTAAGDIGFWQEHVQRFNSPKSYAMVVDALLEQHDPVAAMALLVQWVSQAERIPLVEENYTFHDLALGWMEELWRRDRPADGQAAEHGAASEDRFALAQKFLDYLEANAEQYWQVPRFELGGEGGDDAAEEEQPDNPLSAAYEGVTYRDSTDDGFEGELFEAGGGATDFELGFEAERIMGRLMFLATLAKLWTAAAAGWLAQRARQRHDDVMIGWLNQATANRQQLLGLLAAVHGYGIPPPRGTQEAMIEYDRRRAVKDALLEQVIESSVEMADAVSVICAAVGQRQRGPSGDAWEGPARRVLRAVLRGEVDKVRRNWPILLEVLQEQPLLYVALAKGGSPRRIVAARSIQRVLRRLLAYLPRLGLLDETMELIEAIHDMEVDHPVGQGAISEFDQMFEVGCKGIMRCLAMSSEQWPARPARPRGRQPAGTTSGVTAARSDTELLECLETVTEALLQCWLAHSRGVRLSVLEMINDQDDWRELEQFIKRYGGDLFTQQFMSLGNLRAILLRGVDAYLRSLEEEPEIAGDLRLLAELDGGLSRDDALRHLGVALEAVVEHYPEYVDYNSTTTQSDRGEMLYTLLDFLRLRSSYDRVLWNLQPVMLAHEVLVRCGHDTAAATWRTAVAERTRKIADDHLKRLSRLVKKYGMRLPSIAERLGQRFVRPLVIDQLCALVGPAMEQLRRGDEPTAFARLEEGISQFAREVSGAGFEVPVWLEALHEEVDQVQLQGPEDEESLDPYLVIPQVRLGRAEVDW